MAKITLNVNRTTEFPFAIEDENGEIQQAIAVCKIPKLDQKEQIRDLLVDIKGVEMTDDEGNEVSKEVLLNAFKSDDDLAAFVVQGYNLGNLKKMEKTKTFLQEQGTSSATGKASTK